MRSVAQPGRALRSGRRGRWFEPSHSDHKSKPAFMPVFICVWGATVQNIHCAEGPQERRPQIKTGVYAGFCFVFILNKWYNLSQKTKGIGYGRCKKLHRCNGGY